MRKMLSLTALIGGLVAASTAQADITIGFVTSLSGPGSSIGIPYGRGIAAAVEYKNEVNGEKIKLIQLDDGSDPSAAPRNARISGAISALRMQAVRRAVAISARTTSSGRRAPSPLRCWTRSSSAPRPWAR